MATSDGIVYMGHRGWSCAYGYCDTTYSTEVDRYDPATQTVSVLAPMPYPMSITRAVRWLGSKILVVAGSAYVGPVAESYLYDPTQNTWMDLAAWPGSSVQDSLTLTDGSVLALDGSGSLYRILPTTPGTPIASTYHALTPTRLLDTRINQGITGALRSHLAASFQVTGDVVPAGARAVTGNLTVTQQSSLGFLYIGPNKADSPTSSTLNFPKGDDRANAVTVSLSPDGQLWVTYAAPTLGPTAHVIFDVTGYFEPLSS